MISKAQLLMLSLKSKGILGNNRRISEYILPYNQRSSYPLVDDKIKTDSLVRKAGLLCPELYFKIEKMSDTKNLHSKLEDISDFVVKPARGAMGNGILIVNETRWDEDRKKTRFITTRKSELTYSAFVYYVSSILSGLYSLNGQPDRVLIQERLKVHSFFKDLTHLGVPDIRVILFKTIPVMAMLRLPTSISGGRGNLHQGAVGCGINLNSGCLTSAIQKNRTVGKHPDSGVEFEGKCLPFWDETLKLAVDCAELVDIGYLGVDIVIHPEKGPMLLEMNARPGLSIQLANQKGLEPSLKSLTNLSTREMSFTEKIELAKSL